MNGKYYWGNDEVGTVTDFDPKAWYGKVTLHDMPEMAEYGTLEPNATVVVDGKTYRRPE